MAFSFLRPRANIFLYGPTKKVNNLSIFFLSKHLNFANILACFLVVISVYSGQRRKVCAFTFVGGQSKVSCWIIKLTFAMFAFVSQLLQNRLNGLYKTYFQNSLCVCLKLAWSVRSHTDRSLANQKAGFGRTQSKKKNVCMSCVAANIRVCRSLA